MKIYEYFVDENLINDEKYLFLNIIMEYCNEGDLEHYQKRKFLKQNEFEKLKLFCKY